MEKYALSFNDAFRLRTKKNALNIVCLYNKLKQRDELRIMGTQLLRSATSVAANFRASCRARSEAEHYSKLSITIEECDEALFWLELIEETGWVDISPRHHVTTYFFTTSPRIIFLRYKHQQSDSPICAG
jgi:four helix bundle protein